MLSALTFEEGMVMAEIKDASQGGPHGRIGITSRLEGESYPTKFRIERVDHAKEIQEGAAGVDSEFESWLQEYFQQEYGGIEEVVKRTGLEKDTILYQLTEQFRNLVKPKFPTMPADSSLTILRDTAGVPPIRAIPLS